MNKNKLKLFKSIAIFLLVNILFQFAFPVVSYALTSGPSQPEIQSFEPVGTTEMVDMFTGDFTYNIPLMELPGPNGGYPFNLSYNAGISMDQEASWVGLGWNLNPGAINRQMRGLPDEFNGDVILKDQDIRPNTTIGVGFGGGVEIFGGDVLKGTVSLGIGLHYNNYKGVGYSLEPGLSMQVSSKSANAGIGFNFSLDSQEGVGVDPSLSLSSHGKKNETSFNLGGHYNSRLGLTGMSMGASVQNKNQMKQSGKGTEEIEHKGAGSYGGSARLSFASQGYSPQVGIPMQGINYAATVKVGGELFGVDGNAFANCFFNTQYLASKHSSAPGYGYMYLQNGGGSSSLMDLNREKDGMVTKNSLNLASPTMTYDIYSVAGQGIGGMYRPYRSDVGVLKDQSVSSTTVGGAGGFEAAFGELLHFGFDASINYSNNTSGAWTENNNTANTYKFIPSVSTNVQYEPYYFKTYGEHTSDSINELNYIGNTEPVRIDLHENGSFLDKRYTAQQTLTGKSGATMTAVNLNPTENREPRNLTVQPIINTDLTNGRFGTKNEILAEYKVKYYPPNISLFPGSTSFNYRGSDTTTVSTLQKQPLSRSKGPTHTAGFSATNPDGTRYVYALPAYNNSQKECQFSVLPPPPANACDPIVPIDKTGPGGSINYNGNSYNNTDKSYSRTTLPPYAHSYLLTSILGPDYIDADTIAGPSVGDFGYWVNFTYIKTTSTDYNWRVPFKGANYIKGYKTTPWDDKGAYTYGTKEVWHVAKAETKSHVAIFYIDQRKDGRGAYSELQNTTVDSTRDAYSYKLNKISLYARNEYEKLVGIPVAIKNVNFQYTYDLCGGVHNNNGSATGKTFFTGIDLNANYGKLTLKKVWFTDENNTRGAVSPYEFDYHERNTNLTINTSDNPPYSTHKYDRWGNFKSYDENGSTCDNMDIPYVRQDTAYSASSRNASIAVWSLKSITLPSGGKIDITYESDDYAYVQNKVAMQMTKIASLSTNPSDSIINHPKGADATHRRIYFQLEHQIPKIGLNTKNEVRKYIDPSGQIYFRVYINLLKASQPNFKDFVSGYANITNYNVDSTSGGTGNFYTRGYVELANLQIAGRTQKYHPFSMAAWQHIRTAQPDLANFGDFPGDPNTKKGQTVEKMTSLISCYNELQKIFKGYYDFAYDDMKSKRVPGQSWATRIDLSKSFIRLNSPDKIKYGGGIRVKQIALNDSWKVSTNGADSSSTYGQVYDYTTIENGAVISSGVATYEPMIGGDETALRYARSYAQSIPLMTPNNLFTEYPINETYYPAPSVGYRKVTVKSLATYYTTIGGNSFNIPTGIMTSGATVHEFYTAKDFPVINNETDINKQPFNIFIPIPLLGQITVNHMTASQGYSVELNDMHGKAKQISNYQMDAKGNVLPEPISWIRYNYQSKPVISNGSDRNLDYFVLNNTVQALLSDKNGVVSKQARLVGQDFEFFTDMRENKTFSCVGGIAINTDIIEIGPIPIPAFVPWPNVGTSTTTLRTAVTNKIIHRSGILVSTEAYDGSSIVKTENKLFDALTGQPVLTTVTNDFEDPIYNYNTPAHLVYDQMGPAYKNIGISFSATLASGNTIASTGAAWESLLVPGDEFIISRSGDQTRAIYTGKTGSTLNFALDKTVTFVSYTFLLVRSGRRNHLSAFAGNVTSLKDPTVNRRTDSCSYSKVFPASTGTNKWVLTNCAYQAMDGVNYFLQTINNGTYSYSSCPDSSIWSPKQVVKNDVYGASIYSVIWPMDNACTQSCNNGYLILGLDRRPTADTSHVGFYWGSDPGNFTYYGFCPPKQTYRQTVGCQGNQSFNVGFFTLAGGVKTFIRVSRILSISKPYIDYSYTFPSEDVNSMNSYGIMVNLQINTVNGIISQPAYVDANYPSTLYFYWKTSTTQPVLTFTPSTITTKTHNIDSTLNSSATIFANSWPLDNTLLRGAYWSDTVYGGTNRNTFASRNSFITGVDGINRSLESYTYVDNRNQSSSLNLRKDGAYNNMPLFDWANPALPECNPKWRKINTITDYSPFSFETENKDILGVYSSALYDYSGNVVTAIAINASDAELGFESFEEFKASAKIDSNNYGAGNITLLTNSNINKINVYRNYKIVAGNNNYIIIDKAFDPNIDISSVSVNGYSVGLLPTLNQIKGNFNVINVERDPNNTGNTVLTLDPSQFTYAGGKWMGYGKFRLTISSTTPQVTISPGPVVVSSAFAHTGKQSLKVTGTAQFEQRRLNLTPGNKYFFSSWVNNGSANAMTYGAATNFTGVQVILNFLDGNHVAIPGSTAITLYPSGNVIENWQKLEGEFIVPANCASMLLTLYGGSVSGSPVTAYFDDIRISPTVSDMKTYVYDNVNLRIKAILDNNNYATLYYYDAAGKLYLIKKETEKGIMTIQETLTHQKEH